MQRSPLVTIVLPTYNRAAKLRGAVRSCLAQSYRQIEVIIVDDGSPDETPEIGRTLEQEDPRVSYLRNVKNLRIPGALNAGFRRSRGEYLTWTSDDNLYEPDAIQVMVEALEQRPDAGLVYGDYRVIDDEGKEVGLRRLGPPERLPYENCVGACFLYRRSVYEAVGDYDESLFLVEDYDYWLRIAARFPLHYLEGCSPYRYREHPGSLTARRNAEVRIARFQAQLKHAPGLPGRCAIWRRSSADISWAALESGNWPLAARAFLVQAVREPWVIRHWQLWGKCAVRPVRNRFAGPDRRA